MTLEELESKALKLNPNSRAKLAEKLLHSLESLADAEIERLWAEEALHRHEELESRAVQVYPLKMSSAMPGHASRESPVVSCFPSEL